MMSADRLRKIAANCEDVSFIASEDNARELMVLADQLEQNAESLKLLRRQASQLSDFMYGAVRDCAKDMLIVINGMHSGGQQ